MRKIEINPVSRIEGHAKVAVFLDSNDRVESAFFQATELRGYEKLVVGMPVEEVPRVVSTICGICRAVHFIAALKAADQIFSAEVPDGARIIREILLLAHVIEDHTLALLALGLPDFVSPEQRDIFGVLRRLGEIGKDILMKRKEAVKIIKILGGKSVHPVAGVPGGWAKKVNGEDILSVERSAKDLVNLGERIFQILSKYTPPFDCNLNVYRMATLSGKFVNFYDGIQVIVDSSGKKFKSFYGRKYLDVISEKVVEWNYSKIPYLKEIGWRGIIDGPSTSFYLVGPLSRIKAGRLTPIAQDMADSIDDSNVFYSHWARAIEIVYAAERILALCADYSGHVRGSLGEVSGEGVGIVEAPRGTLIHHYITDQRGIVRDANIVVATTQNMGPINVAIRKAAEKGKNEMDMLEKIELVIRAFDPCMACATHAINGSVPIELEIYREGRLEKVVRNFDEACSRCG